MGPSATSATVPEFGDVGQIIRVACWRVKTWCPRRTHAMLDGGRAGHAMNDPPAQSPALRRREAGTPDSAGRLRQALLLAGVRLVRTRSPGAAPTELCGPAAPAGKGRAARGGSSGAWRPGTSRRAAADEAQPRRAPSQMMWPRRHLRRTSGRTPRALDLGRLGRVGPSRAHRAGSLETEASSPETGIEPWARKVEAVQGRPLSRPLSRRVSSSRT